MRIVICDGDLTFAQWCKNRLLELSASHNIPITVDIVESGKKLLFYEDTKYAQVDLIYMDCNMDSLNGLETAKILRQNGFTADIVFCSQDTSHAIDGYDVSAMHYIVKGHISDAKFEEIFLKAVQRWQSRRCEIITFSHCGEVRSVPVRDIVYFEISNRTVTVHYFNGHQMDSFAFISSLSEVEERLTGKGFLRIHAAYLVSENYIRKKSARQVEMSTGDVLAVGKSRRV